MSEIWSFFWAAEGKPLRSAFLFLLLASPSFGSAGVFTSMKNFNSSIGSLTHTAIAGIGLSFYARYHWNWSWLSPFWGMLLIILLAVFIIFLVELHGNTRLDTLLNMTWAAGTAAGLLLLSAVPGATNVTSFFWGNLLFISDSNLWQMLALNFVIFLALLLPWRYHQQIIFDRDFIRSRGINVNIYQLIFYIISAYTIITVISSVGILLALGLFSIPSAIASLYAKSLRQMILLAILANFILSWLGMAWSIEKDLSPGSTIILVMIAAYLLALVGRQIFLRLRNPSKN